MDMNLEEQKAFLFHTSAAGAGASAVMYSIVETAKANNLNIFQYLYTVLLYMPDHMNSSAGIEQLLPWSKFIQEHCTGLIVAESNVPENRISLLQTTSRSAPTVGIRMSPNRP